MTSDTLPYEGIDRVVDATKMPFEDESVRAICMTNVFHHIPDVEAFTGGHSSGSRRRVLIVDQHPGWISTPIYKRITTNHFT